MELDNVTVKKKRKRPRTKGIRLELKTKLENAILSAESDFQNLFTIESNTILKAPFLHVMEYLNLLNDETFVSLSLYAIKSITNRTRIFDIKEQNLLKTSFEYLQKFKTKKSYEAWKNLWIYYDSKIYKKIEDKMVYVDNLPAQCSEIKLRRRAAVFGTVVKVFLPKITRIQQQIGFTLNSGFGFVQFASKTAAKRFCKRYAVNSRLKRVKHHHNHHKKKNIDAQSLIKKELNQTKEFIDDEIKELEEISFDNDKQCFFDSNSFLSSSTAQLFQYQWAEMFFNNSETNQTNEFLIKSNITEIEKKSNKNFKIEKDEISNKTSALKNCNKEILFEKTDLCNFNEKKLKVEDFTKEKFLGIKRNLCEKICNLPNKKKKINEIIEKNMPSSSKTNKKLSEKILDNLNFENKVTKNLSKIITKDEEISAVIEDTKKNIVPLINFKKKRRRRKLCISANGHWNRRSFGSLTNLLKRIQVFPLKQYQELRTEYLRLRQERYDIMKQQIDSNNVVTKDFAKDNKIKEKKFKTNLANLKKDRQKKKGKYKKNKKKKTFELAENIKSKLFV